MNRHERDLPIAAALSAEMQARTKRENAQTAIVFDQVGDFAAMYAAEAWCDANGISVGSNQRGDQRGLLRGDFAIAKWRNLSPAERAQLDGTMTGDMRNGPVTVTLKGNP